MNARALAGHFRRWREWETNPILLKELRQAARSQILIGMLLFLLASLFLGAVLLLGNQSLTGPQGSLVGQKLFEAFLTVLAIGSVAFVPLYTGIRFAVERQELDLMFFTLMTESRVVRGKLAGGIYLAGLFFSACMPFMTFCNLFGGVDLFTILFVLAALFAAACLSVLVAVAIAAVRSYALFKVFLGLAFTAALAVFGRQLLVFFFGAVQSGAGMLFQSSDFCITFGCLIFFGTIAAWWLYGISVLSIAVLRNPQKYRDKTEPALEPPNE